MNRLILALFVLAFTLFGCKSKKKMVETPNGTVELLRPNEAIKAFKAKQNPPSWVKIVASVRVVQDGSPIDANADIRMKQDSIMWVELSDNIVGIKAARAFAMEDTVAFYNRIDRTYFAGAYSYVETKLGTSLPFPYIFQVFQGQLFVNSGNVEILNNRYVLSEKQENGDAFLAEIEPFYLDCVYQELTTKTDIIKVTYQDYVEQYGFRFPQKIFVEVLGRKNLTASFQVKSIEAKGPYKMPFNISSKYERIE